MTERKPLFERSPEPPEILSRDNPALREVCAPVADDYPLNNLRYELRRAMNYPQGIGIAAPQIGEFVRALLVRVPHGRSEVQYFIANPEIYWASKHKTGAWEGCLSFPPGFRAFVKRHHHIKVRGINEFGVPIHFGGKGILARVLQHEIDHLDGKLMIDDAVRVDDRSKDKSEKMA